MATRFVFIILSILVSSCGMASVIPHEENKVEDRQITVSSTAELEQAVGSLKPDSGTEIILTDGKYHNIKLIVSESGILGDSIVIRAQNPGKVSFTGDVKVELRGNYIVLKGIVFRDGTRNQSEWRSHGPGLVAIYGSHVRVSGCLFHRFDTADSAWITTSLDEKGNVPQHCRIDHCAFIEKTTYDQVINLNNTPKKSETGEAGVPMYHRIDHCYFSNPKKVGNAGGGIRIGYWRKDYGRCLVDHNLFERQDSEPEIITGKSTENIYLNNTILNCRGTLNFRHGDRQVAINNFFIGSDRRFEYGGMFVWGSGHIIANNYFSLPNTIASRGNAALYFNPGPPESEHALAYNIDVVGNIFADNNGYDIHFSPLYPQRIKAFGDRTKLPYDIRFAGNIFFASPSKKSDYTVFCDEHNIAGQQQWEQNFYTGCASGLISDPKGFENKPFETTFSDGRIYPSKDILSNGKFELRMKAIQGLDIDFEAITQGGITGKPLTRADVGPLWCGGVFPGTYADNGVSDKELKARLKANKERTER
ncbi:chondroitinase-B domain-containing protein [Dysgonomonas sp. 511]|uniref:chondroitinase-B domain-containing protein n=1 Tax=Dysgonomonas sp. 511 TaxID=2302930 RepID=UPI0013D17330|nr:chondroitinase-B domain-containing protein [Dysgonomonas sp. 511]NDV78777.1 chloramphenicol resistance protein [Dysgonomonas sp. 511]